MDAPDGIISARVRSSDTEARIKAEARADAVAQRLMTIPFVGPMIAHATVAAIGEGQQFGSARDYAAWLGLTRRTSASGQTRRTRRISKAGDQRLRRLYVLGRRWRWRPSWRAPSGRS
ncbi:transposase [Methylobacterium aquaticum]|uniref:transposase n=1 Tax=Methylobacterium aquaticum TaxID=270351 RepID=UPI0019348F02|nr:transposase [Methylobacterium aquaticum]QRE76347.1 IS110 family transposase [Methylobacterium aquaticum]